LTSTIIYVRIGYTTKEESDSMKKIYLVISVIPYEGSHLLRILEDLDSVTKYIHSMIDDCEWYRDKLFVIDAIKSIDKELEEMELQSIDKFL